MPELFNLWFLSTVTALDSPPGRNVPTKIFMKINFEIFIKNDLEI